jgi:hypothetical protein
MDIVKNPKCGSFSLVQDEDGIWPCLSLDWVNHPDEPQKLHRNFDIRIEDGVWVEDKFLKYLTVFFELSSQ